MSYMPRRDAAPTAGWPDLVEELDRWEAAGRVASLWWRDDDATEPTTQLETLLRVAGPVPVGLAVIPSQARAELASALPATATVLQHGWRHVNHAAMGKKSEYPADRPASLVASELLAGRERLQELFGPQLVPIFVPPWNRMSPRYWPLLPETGVTVLSGMVSRQPAARPEGLALLDVHVDLTDWHGNRGFVGTATALGGLVRWLYRARLEGGSNPIGVLTHHLVMDSGTLAFVRDLLNATGKHVAARWVAPGEFVS